MTRAPAAPRYRLFLIQKSPARGEQEAVISEALEYIRRELRDHLGVSDS